MLSSNGCPLPGGEKTTFDRSDVAQLGKLYCWGSFVVQFVVRLHDSREVFVHANKQSKADERFLRRLARPIKFGASRLTREEGFRMVWGDRLPQ